MITDMINKLKEFNKLYGVATLATPLPTTSNSDIRARLLAEELLEYQEALASYDEVAVADALTDLMYVLVGTILHHNLDDCFDELFNEVHSSNLSKLGEDGKPIYRADGKIVKGPNFREPDLRSILAKHGKLVKLEDKSTQ